MTVIRTDKWLLHSYKKPAELCQKLKAQFPEDARASDIHQHLIAHGMYQQPPKDDDEWIKNLKEKEIWQIVREEEQKLRKLWHGPDVPIFIFPADPNNRKLQHEQNGKSGLAFPDKVFLFVSRENSANEIRALFTHEYNHVCRLNSYSKSMNDYRLLDTIVLEGTAENAVRERLGNQYTAGWTAYYPNAQLEKLWKHAVYPNRHAAISSRIHQDILYGHRFFPKMAGYCVGYYLVKNYIEATDVTSVDLLDMEPETIMEQTDGG
ncbi:Zn-dependent protease [Lentibacillus lipolyticus]|nr:Zn-dependent protease [Lentibacillus lipolyticus]